MATELPSAEARRAALQCCLGGPWPASGPLDTEEHCSEACDGYTLRRVSYLAEPDDRVPAYLLIPDTATPDAPAPAVAVWHQHNGQYDLGGSEPAGLSGDPMHHTGAALARLGYVVLCPDALCFGGRRDEKLHGADYERFEFLRYVVRGRSLAWKSILDMRRTVDLLCGLPAVDADRLGCYGHSMGSTHTWLVGPWEPRLKCLVGNCCLPTYAAIERMRLLHCFPNFVPGWMEHGDTPEIAALTAPRAMHLNFGTDDSGSPISEVREAVETIAVRYAEAGAPDAFTWYIEEGAGHVLSEEMWRRTRQCLAHHLGGRAE